MATKIIQAQAHSRSLTSISVPPPQPYPPTANPNLPAPTSNLAASQQTTPSPQMQALSPASTPAPRNLSNTLAVWTTIALGLATLITAVYYGAIMLSFAQWTKHNDFREGCIADQDHDLLMSAECSEELLCSRVSAVKRQVEAVHGVCRPRGPFDGNGNGNVDDDDGNRLRTCPRVCPRVCERVCSLCHDFPSENLERCLVEEDDENSMLLTSCSC
jgi:hypothetical protein